MTERIVRTFQPRRRPLSPARMELFDRLEPLWCLADVGPTLIPADVFGRVAPLVLDIGIGIGDSTMAVALVEPDVDVIGIDVHTPGIAASLARIEADQLANVRLVHGDALVFLRRLQSESLSGIRIYFPDPWPKIRHHHRRIVRDDVVTQLVERLQPGGWLHLATDIDDYAGQMLDVCERNPDLGGGVIARPDSRPVTRYEKRGTEAGRTATDLWYVNERLVSDTKRSGVRLIR